MYSPPVYCFMCRQDCYRFNPVEPNCSDTCSDHRMATSTWYHFRVELWRAIEPILIGDMRKVYPCLFTKEEMKLR